MNKYLGKNERVPKFEESYQEDHLEGPYNKVNQIEAVKIIEKCWCAYRDKQMFRLLKHTVCAAEHSLSHEILRKISPLESNILTDPCIKIKIKFRFSGFEFPPSVVFKIYSQMQDGRIAKHITGKNMIKPASSAAQEACNQMGNKQYYNLMILDSLQNVSNRKISEKTDIVSIRDYMQYSSLIDDLPAYLGGRSNSWRRLNLTDLQRHTIFFDVINYATTKKMSKNLLKELPVLLKCPKTQEIQLQQIKALSKLEYPLQDVPKNSSVTYLSSSNYKTTPTISTTSRRSKNALTKVSRMKRIYTNARSETITTEGEAVTENTSGHHSIFKLPDDLNDEFEDEVKNLYLWTQNLSTNDELISSPRFD